MATITQTGPARTNAAGDLWWPVRVISAGGEEQTLRLPHAEGDRAPTRADVAAHIEGLPEEHALSGAHVEERITRRQFVRRFKPEETQAILAARETDALVAQVWMELTTATYIDLAEIETAQSVGYLESVGLIAEGRAQEILATIE